MTLKKLAESGFRKRFSLEDYVHEISLGEMTLVTGKEQRKSEWFAIEQGFVGAFADLTEDVNPVHVAVVDDAV